MINMNVQSNLNDAFGATTDTDIYAFTWEATVIEKTYDGVCK